MDQGRYGSRSLRVKVNSKNKIKIKRADLFKAIYESILVFSIEYWLKISQELVFKSFISNI